MSKKKSSMTCPIFVSKESVNTNLGVKMQATGQYAIIKPQDEATEMDGIIIGSATTKNALKRGTVVGAGVDAESCITTGAEVLYRGDQTWTLTSKEGDELVAISSKDIIAVL
jgi:co-chaperonin GroES (HSP10)